MKALNAQKRELAARMLCTAALTGDKEAAKQFGVSTKTIQRYRELARTDQALSDSVKAHQQLADQQWLDQIPSILAGAMEFIAQSQRCMNPADELHLRAIAEATQVISEQAQAWKALNVRINRPAGAQPPPTGPVVPGAGNGAATAVPKLAAVR